MAIELGLLSCRNLLLHNNVRPDIGSVSVLPKEVREQNANSLLWTR